MKKRIETKVIAFIMLLVMIITMLPAMDASAKTSKKAVPVLTENSATLYVKGDYATQYAIRVANLAADAAVTYSSSNRKVASVSDEGVVTPLKKGNATIFAKVIQGGKAYKLKLKCTVKKAQMIFAAKKAQKTTAETPVTISVGDSLKTKLRLGGKAVSVFSQDKKNKGEAYNVKAVIFDAKSGKQLTKAKNSLTNKYISISENGVITAKKKGEYYIEFTSFPEGCTNRIFVTVKKAAKKPAPTEEPEAAKPTPTPLPGVYSQFIENSNSDNNNQDNSSKTEDSPKTEDLGNEDVFTDLSGVEKTPSFVTVNLTTDKVSGYTFEISGYREGVIESFINVADDSQVAYEVSGETIIPGLEKGKTYSVKLAEDSGARFVLDGNTQDSSVSTLNIITDKETVMNLSINALVVN